MLSRVGWIGRSNGQVVFENSAYRAHQLMHPLVVPPIPREVLCPVGYLSLVGDLSSQQLVLPLKAGAYITTVPE